MTLPARWIALSFAASTLVWLHGCESPPPGEGPAAQMERQSAQAEAAAKQRKAEAAAQAEATRVAATEKLKNEAPSLVTEDDFKKGKSLKGGGYLSQVARARFVAEHRITMDIQLQQAMTLYYATEGEFPKSHEEFVKKILEPNFITLPELDGPYEYVYNPEDQQLYKKPIVQEGPAGADEAADGGAGGAEADPTVAE